MSTLPLVLTSIRFPSLSRPTLKWIALGYVVKTAAFGVAWYFVPDLPQRLATGARAAWGWLLTL
jgi:hypothetical protein